MRAVIVVNGASDRTAAESVANEVRSLGVRALVAMGDVGKQDEALRIADLALNEFGTVDVLVDNTATEIKESSSKSPKKRGVEQWRSTSNRRTGSVARLCQE